MLNSNRVRHLLDQGQSLVEFALVLPVLLIVLLGVLDLGRLYFAYVTVTNASREGARLGMIKPANTASIQTRTQRESANALHLSSSNIVIECAAYSNNPPYAYSTEQCVEDDLQPGDRIRVTVNYNFQFLSLYLFRMPAIKLSNSTSMAIMQAGAGEDEDEDD